MAIEGASLTPIYNRLNSVGGYHPMNVDSFADWSVEAGDIVSVSRDGTAYASPVHSTRLVWRGSPEMQINATGKEKRDNIAKVSRRKYGRGGAGMRNNQGLYYEMFNEDGTVHSSLLMTASVLRTEFHGEISDVHSNIQQTASQIRSEVYAANSSIYSYVDQTATYIWDHVGHSSMTYAQMDDPADMPGAQMAEGDVWVQSPFVRTWDDAENLTWDEMQELQWDQLKGATVWVWKDGGWKKAVDETELAKDTDLIRTDDYIKLFAKEQVAKNGQVDQYIADLTVTARQIRSDVSASRSELYSSIVQTATYIMSTVNDTKNDLHSEIIQTSSEIRSSVWAEESQIYSFVKQTATYIWERVASKPRVFPQMTSPQGTAEEPLKDGDVWIYSPFIRTWDDAAEHTWDEMEQFQWDNLKGAQVFVRKNGKWQLAIDEMSLAKETDVVKTDEYVKLFAKEQVAKNGRVDQYISDLTVTARQIRSDVSASRSELYSSIQQTATNILMTVNNVQKDLHSEIEQTASSIRSSVYASESMIYSSILETATSIRSEVGNALSGTYSTIEQTASSIRADVYASESSIYSSIQQTASQIRTEVASSISGVNSTITQTASAIRSEVADSISGVNSTITQTASSIRSEVAAAESTIHSSITQTASSISAEVTRATNKETEIEGKLIVEAGKAGLVAQLTDNREVLSYASSSQFPGTGSENYLYLDVSTRNYFEWKNGSYIRALGPGATISASTIVTAINDDGSSNAVINADHVSITGNAKISGSLEISDGDLKVKRSTVIQGNLTLTTAGSYIQAPKYVVESSGSISFNGTESGETYGLSTTVLKGMVKSFGVEAGVLTLTPFYGDPVTFSRATTLSGAWGSGDDNDKFIVTATPQGNTYKYSPPLRLNGSGSASNFTAEITETTQQGEVAKKSVSGYLVETGSRTSTSVVVYNSRTERQGGGYDYSGQIAALSVGGVYKSGWNAARGYTVDNLPTSIGAYIDGDYKTIKVKYPGTDGSSTLTEKSYTLAVNENFRPQGATVDVRAVELKDGNDVVARISAGGNAPSNLNIYDSDNTARTSNISLGYGGSITLKAGYSLNGAMQYASSIKVSGKELPSISGLDRKSTGVSGTSVGDVSSKTGTYVTFQMGGSNYYIKVG